VVPVGIGQDAVAIALERSTEDMIPYVAELQARRDVLLDELKGLPVGVPEGGWSMLLRVADYGIDGAEMSKRLLQQGICATAMTGWGVAHGAQYIRFVFANEPIARLTGAGVRIRAALEQV
jgi:aspartate/methionine/tyrosine aminotransferase